MAEHTVCERLDNGLTLLEKQGWGQESYRRGCLEGPVCIVGALITNDEYKNTGVTVTFMDLRAALEALGFSSWASALAWNDQRGRTKDEVVARIITAKEAHCGKH